MDVKRASSCSALKNWSTISCHLCQRQLGKVEIILCRNQPDVFLFAAQRNRCRQDFSRYFPLHNLSQGHVWQPTFISEMKVDHFTTIFMLRLWTCSTLSSFCRKRQWLPPDLLVCRRHYVFIRLLIVTLCLAAVELSELVNNPTLHLCQTCFCFGLSHFMNAKPTTQHRRRLSKKSNYLISWWKRVAALWLFGFLRALNQIAQGLLHFWDISRKLSES